MSSLAPAFSRVRRLPGSRQLKLALVTFVPVAFTLALGSQLLLPPLAQSRIADRLSSRFGSVRSLDVSATPAVKLLWGDSDSVDVHLGAIDATALGGGDGRLAEVPQFRAEVDELATRMGDVSDVHLRKSGDEFDADLVIDAAALGDDAAGRRLALEPEVSADGALYVRLAAGPEARGDGLRLQVVAADGVIVARPDGTGLIGRLVGTQTLFAHEQLRFDSLRAAPEESGIRVELTGHTAS